MRPQKFAQISSSSLLGLVLLASGLLLACGPNKPPASGDPGAKEQEFYVASSEEEQMAEAFAEEESTSSCDIHVELLLEKQEDGSLKVATKLTNSTKRQLSVKWSAACPGAGVAYEGNLDGYDYGNGCQAGACAGSEDHFSLDLGPEGQAAVGVFSVMPKGDACNKPLKDGTYTITPASEFSGGTVCAKKPGSFTARGGTLSPN